MYKENKKSGQKIARERDIFRVNQHHDLKKCGEQLLASPHFLLFL
ncbi:hypothetical protein JOD43_000195 [Pullulanibacillus pueri]|nr:hypothetical protein [Pullulanibacillus pueri]